MKKLLVIALALLMLLSIAACQNNSNNADIEAMKLQMQLMQAQLDEAKKTGEEPSEPVPESTTTLDIATLAPVPVEEESGDLIVALHSTIDGEKNMIIDGITELTATAVIPDGMAVDCWELNGDAYHEDMEDTFTFTAQGDTVVDARLRPEHKVTAINAEMQFLDAKGKPKGDAFTEFVFEEDYENPVTGETLPGGWITVNVKAVVPKGYEVDYWLINDVPYHYNRTVSSFSVHDLNETTVYEVMLKKKNAASATAKPEQAPTTSYQVTCKFCKFSGGGYSGATSGSVPAGTKITVTADFQFGGYWEGSYVAGSRGNASGVKSFTYTVNSDCSFKHNDIVN